MCLGGLQIAVKDGEKPSVQVKEFDGLSHEGVESYWQQLQLQVSQWVLEERQMTWAMGSDSQPSQFFSPRSGTGEDLQQSDTEALVGHKATEDTHYSSRRRVCLVLLGYGGPIKCITRSHLLVYAYTNACSKRSVDTFGLATFRHAL